MRAGVDDAELRRGVVFAVCVCDCVAAGALFAVAEVRLCVERWQWRDNKNVGHLKTHLYVKCVFLLSRFVSFSSLLFLCDRFFFSFSPADANIFSGGAFMRKRSGARVAPLKCFFFCVCVGMGLIVYIYAGGSSAVGSSFSPFFFSRLECTFYVSSPFSLPLFLSADIISFCLRVVCKLPACASRT